MLDALISAGANLLGNIMSNSSKSDTNAMQMQIAQMNNATQEKWAQKNLDFQGDIAKHGLQYKVQDAIAAGIHPLAGLGATTFSPSPVSVGSSSPTLESKSYDFSSIGQDLGRAAKSLQTEETRKAADEAEARKLTLEKGSLENDLLRSELASKLIRSRTGGQLAPAMPTSVPSRIPLPRPGPERSYGGYALSEDEMKQKAEGAPSTRTLRWYGLPLDANPASSDAQDHENRYGEWGGDIIGLTNIPGDIAHTMGNRLPAWFAEKYRNYDRRWLYNSFRRR